MSVAVVQGPLEVRENLWSVGHRNPSSLLQCNTYVRTFDSGSSRLPVCIDPGSQFDYPVIQANVAQLLGDVGELRAFSVNHQDPDVIGNAQALCEANPNIGMLVTEEVWRLAQHLRLTPNRVHFANAARSRMMVLGDEHRWQLVPTPFCHFRGAMAFYDTELRTLYSGDLFGGLNRPGRVQLLAEESDWMGIAQFHQIYMPVREALRYAVRQIRALSPKVEVIAPQHGHVITGDLVDLFLDRMHELLVGFDLISVELDPTYLQGYQDVLYRLLGRAAATLGADEVVSRLKSTAPDDGLEHLVAIKGYEVRLQREGYSAITKIFSRLTNREPPEWSNELRTEVLAGCTELGVPIPPIGVGIEERTPPDSIGPDGIRTQAWWL